jgi:hypothetical protein
MKHPVKIGIDLRILLLSAIITQSIHAQSQAISLFNFEPDVRVFTLHAFMNMAGVDGEWRKEGMHPLRIEICEKLKKTLDTAFIAKINSYTKRTENYGWAGWARYALLTSGPPDFKLEYDSLSTDIRHVESNFPNLSGLVSEFYTKADIPTLWKTYLPLYKKLNDGFKPHAQKAIDDIVVYCRLDSEHFQKNTSKIHVQFSPLMPYFTAQQATVNNELWLIFGPQEGETSASSYYHEVLHEVVNPITESNPSSLTKLDPLFQLLKDKVTSYDVVNESFVRTIDKVLSGTLHGYSEEKVRQDILNEYKLGFILCPIIFESIPEYEESNMSFKEFYLKVINKIDIKTESERWEQFHRE